MSVLIVLNHDPYDGTDVTWNALRLAGQLLDDGVEMRLFLMNDSVDLARDSVKPPAGYFDLVEMTKDLIDKGVAVKACGTCQARCGLRKGEPYYEGPQKATIGELSEWVRRSDRVLVF
ncbi:MAG: DsrE family protein [Proteobacteria bacterium]|nr:DsrE family protein [Pseudomonadota bacterium]